MTTHYYLPEPELPEIFTSYCDLHQYRLSIKKRYIIGQILNLKTDTDIEMLLASIGRSCNKVSRSCVYLVLQWMIAHQFVTRISNGQGENCLYRLNNADMHLTGKENNSHNLFPVQTTSHCTLGRQ